MLLLHGASNETFLSLESPRSVLVSWHTVYFYYHLCNTFFLFEFCCYGAQPARANPCYKVGDPGNLSIFLNLLIRPILNEVLIFSYIWQPQGFILATPKFLTSGVLKQNKMSHMRFLYVGFFYQVDSNLTMHVGFFFFFCEYVGFFYQTHGFNIPSFITFSNHMEKKFMWSSFISLSLANTISDPITSPIFGKVIQFNKLL